MKAVIGKPPEMDWVTPKPDFTYEELSELESAIKQDPSNAAMYYRYGVVCRRYYQHENASAAFQKAVSLAPDEGEYVIALANALIKKNEFLTAQNLLNTIPADRQSSPYRLALIKILLALNFTDKAFEQYEKIPPVDPEKPQALRKIFDMLFNVGDYNKCLSFCETQLAITPFNTTTLALEAAALQALGKNDELTNLLGLEELVVEIDLSETLECNHINDFNEAINQHLQEQTAFYEAKTAIEGYRLDLVDYSDLPEIKRLKDKVKEKVSSFTEKLCKRSSWFASSVPAIAKLHSWGNISDTYGYKKPHYHPSGWLTAVYYVSVPNKEEHGGGGNLELGRPPRHYSGVHSALIKVIRPAEGKLVIFPSFLFHGTVPQQVEGKRISITFDIIPV